jgi:adenylylsulfate kinase
MSRCYWVTGLSASGKTTISRLLSDHLRSLGTPLVWLDGDQLREVLSSEAYTREERLALGMRYSRLCKMLVQQEITVVISVIGLFKEIHDWNRENISNYTEIFLDTPMEELKRRDPKGIYKRALSGNLKNVAGVDIKVDFPSSPDIVLKWETNKDANETYNELISELNTHALI